MKIISYKFYNMIDCKIKKYFITKKKVAII